MEKFYYLDNASTTKVFEDEFDLIKNLNENFYNPSASYKPALQAKKKLNDARSKMESLLFGKNGKLIFTGSATESNNTVFEGLHLRAGQVVLISVAEHPSVYNAAHRLEKKGIIVKDIPISTEGIVEETVLKNMLSNDVALVSIMHVSNETGAINDIENLCKAVKSFNKNIIFHSDGVQAFGKIEVNLEKLNVDLYTISAHKIYSMRGIGGLWIKRGAVIDPLLEGGGQEFALRSSTENVAGAVCFAYAAEKVCKELKQNFEKTQNLKIELENLLNFSEVSKYLKVNSNKNSSPYILSISFDSIKGEVLMNALEDFGLLVSTGSACSSKKAGNRTLEAMKVPKNFVIGSIRISFSPYEDYDIEYIAKTIADNVIRFEKNVNVLK